MTPSLLPAPYHNHRFAGLLPSLFVLVVLVALTALTAVTIATKPAAAQEAAQKIGQDSEATSDHWSNLNLATASKEQVLGLVTRLLNEREEWVAEAIETWQLAANAGARDEALALLYETVVANPNTPRVGAADADVVLVEFFDYNCGFCKRMTADLIKLLATDDGVALVLVEFPVLAETSLAAAQAALFAQEKGDYWAYHVNLMEREGAVTEQAIGEALAAAGIDGETFQRFTLSPTHAEAMRKQIETHWKISEGLGIRGTPALVIGQEVTSGYRTFEQLQAAVAAARS